MRTMKTRTATALGALALTASGFGAIATSPSADAAARNGSCESGEFCYNFNSDLGGSWSDFTKSVGDYGTSQPGCYEFRTKNKPGAGKCIKNNAGGYWNRSGKTVTVFYNSNFGGTRKAELKPGTKGKLPTAVNNENASHRIGNPPPVSGSWASPVPQSAVITARFPNYPSGGYHGATDYSGFSGKFKSACTGTIDQVKINPTYPNSNAEGVSGSTNYLWVNCGGGIRMGYAHFYKRDLPSTLKVGTKVKAGQELVNVGNQGNSSGKHLHFEVRRNGSPIDGHQFLKNKGVKGLPN